ncbi:hypothetical protein [Microbacterium neungamense]|uniref:hypothetical protein n=1 Tax=Microbacterium neungamense TaxID=2810535 RepID=UPI00217E65F2|nr:hypothetical protein [Microbacterium neungamense]
MVALYGATRLAAGRREPGRAPVAWSLIALGAFGMLAASETSASRDALEPASLLLTTTYYSATVIGAVVAVGLMRRLLDTTSRRVLLGTTFALGVTTVVSTVSNPLFVAWAVAPLVVILAVRAVRDDQRMPSLSGVGALLAGAAGGMIGRIPLSEWIANSGTGYAQPALWQESMSHYAALGIERLASPHGLAAAVLTAALIALCVVRSIRAGDGSGVIALYGWLAPALVVLGAIALGTHAARYLAPIAFAPVLGLVARPTALPSPRLVRRAAASVAAVALAAGVVIGIPTIGAAAGRPDPDLTCVTDWVDGSGRTGAGQFWTVRLPKLHLAEPSRLVQVDHRLRGYAWLVNRTDFAVGEVTFLVEDAQTVPWDLPPPGAVPDRVIECGRYRILDYASHPLPLGPQRS